MRWKKIRQRCVQVLTSKPKTSNDYAAGACLLPGGGNCRVSRLWAGWHGGGRDDDDDDDDHDDHVDGDDDDE